MGRRYSEDEVNDLSTEENIEEKPIKKKRYTDQEVKNDSEENHRVSKSEVTRNKPIENNGRQEGFFSSKKWSDPAVTSDAIGKIGRAVDTYGGDGAARAGVYAAQDGKNPLAAAFHQYGKPDGPTGKMIAEKAGVPDKPFPELAQKFGRVWKDGTLAGRIYKMLPQNLQHSIDNSTQSDVAGLGLDMAISPLSAGIKPIAKGLKALSPVGQYIANKLGHGASHLAEGLTGAPAQDIRTYATKHAQVQDRIKSSGGNSAVLADDVRKGYQSSLSDTRKTHNAAISAAENAASSEKTIPIDVLIYEVQKAKGKLHPKLDASEIAQLSQLEKILKDAPKSTAIPESKWHEFLPDSHFDAQTVADTAGKVSPDELVKMTRSLQEKGGVHGVGPSGEQLGNQVQQGAKNAGREARKLRNEHVPGVKEPFEKLEKINEIAEEANPNLFQPGKPDPSFYAAGSGRNHRGVENLTEMGKATGTDMLGPAKEASAARTFMTPALTPLDTTGKSFYRYAVASEIPGLGKLAALITSPAALKAAIDAGYFAKPFLDATIGTAGKMTAKNYQEIYAGLKAAQMEEKRNKTMEHIKKRKQQPVK